MQVSYGNSRRNAMPVLKLYGNARLELGSGTDDVVSIEGREKAVDINHNETPLLSIEADDADSSGVEADDAGPSGDSSASAPAS